MKRIHTDLAPAAIGTYSQAIQAGNFVFISGQIPLDPSTNLLVAGSFENSVHQVFKNLRAVCEAAGGSLQNIVKLNVYVTDLKNFPELNKIMAEYFFEPYPARAAVQVSALPKGAEVEMDGIMSLS